ncbi:MAG: acyl-[acyl-carrier-protein] thioesterase [Solirubrobacterales bacterium]
MSRGEPAPAEIVPEPGVGRVFEMRLRPGFADVTPTGRARLDAVARWLQDAAYLDVVDAGFDHRGAWIVRRTRIRAERMPRFGEDLTVRTFCSGIGRFCAERRTAVGGTRASVQAVATWVCLDPERSVPMRFDDDFAAVYAESARGRAASVRLRHPAPSPDASAEPWSFRTTDLDLAGHVNNSRYWEAIESALLGGEEPEEIDLEIEHRAAGQPGGAVILRSGDAAWIADDDGRVLASILPGRSGV